MLDDIIKNRFEREVFDAVRINSGNIEKTKRFINNKINGILLTDKLDIIKQSPEQYKDFLKTNEDVENALSSLAEKKLIEQADLENVKFTSSCQDLLNKEPSDAEKVLKEMSEHLSVGSSAEQFYNFVKSYVRENPMWFDVKGTKLFWKWDKQKNVWMMSDKIDAELDFIKKYSFLGTTEYRTKGTILHDLELCAYDWENGKPIDPPKTWVQFNDTIIDIATGEKADPSPKYFMRNVIPHKLGSSKDTPMIDKLLKDWLVSDKLNEEDALKFGYQLLAYAMLRYYPIHVIFTFYGSGSNGKSTFLRLIDKLLGTDNMTAVDLEKLTNSFERFHTAKLYGKLVAYAGDCSYRPFENTRLLKQATGEDMMNGEMKGHNPFDFWNYAKMFFATNGIPITKDKSEGFYRRFLIIDFVNKFKRRDVDVIDEIPEYELENMCLKSIDVLQELLTLGVFHKQPSVERMKEIYENHSNPVLVFISKACETDDDDGLIEVQDFKKRLDDWCRQNRRRVPSPRESKDMMLESGFTTTRKYNQNGVYVTYWRGISWKEVANNQNNLSCFSGDNHEEV